MVNYLGLQDLEKRWVYTRQGVHKVSRRRDFPQPSFTINSGKTKVWLLAAVEAYERQRPQLLSEARKAFGKRRYGAKFRSGPLPG